MACVEKIGFLVQTQELLNHFGPVMNLLPANSFDVLVCGETEGNEAFASAVARWQCNIISVDAVLKSGVRYQSLVSNHPATFGENIKKLAEKNVRFMYAAGKTAWNLSEWNAFYDLILCFGPYHATAFANCSNAVILQMGYPRFDAYFSSPPDKRELHTRFNCDPAKKTVVWLPTWSTLSSVGGFAAEIAALSDAYNVVVKLHPLMLGDEPERVRTLQQYGFTCLITDATDNGALYALADFMLFDYGGPPMAGIYTDKKMLLLNVPGAESDSLTGENSPDITIRSHIVNVNAEDRMIAPILADTAFWKTQTAVRHRLRKEYFAPYFGFSANVAASALLNLKHILGDGSRP